MGYIGEDITDGRWQKIEYDSIPDYCFYCKHQGHKESDCIIKKRDIENKQRKELEKNKSRQDSTLKNNEDVQITKTLEGGRREIEHNQPRQQTNNNQSQRPQEEWHTQRRRTGNQQVRFNADKAVTPQPQVQTDYGSGLEVHTDQVPQHMETSTRTPQIHVHSAEIKDHSDQRTTQQRRSNQEPGKEHIGCHQETITKSAIGGLDGSGQEKNSCNQSRIAKVKGKIGEQGSLNDKVPPDKSNPNKIQQITNKSNFPNVSNPVNDPSIHQRDNFDEYKEPDSEDEYDDDTQTLEEGKETGEGTSTSYQFQKGPLLQTSNVEDIRDVAGKQGLSPRGRKLLKHNPNTSISKPNTRARSRGF
ncbi:hypothetical protein EJD97_012277 [Solanum chilense]|uniref:Uncharacterized protein n=1 Tax=Solanum chilense TaxID=4083 RepID=A0A6N2AMB8_SOLCI|nr:hypothetical protein EJD97_012277 [Solanum chilense]